MLSTLFLGLLTSRTVRKYIFVVLIHYVCGHCYRSNRNLIESVHTKQHFAGGTSPVSSQFERKQIPAHETRKPKEITSLLLALRGQHGLRMSRQVAEDN